MNTTSSSEDEDPLQEARAYNRSIYLMVSMPYLLLGAIGLGVYRGMKSATKRNRPEVAGNDMPAEIGQPAQPLPAPGIDEKS
jgi:hypothetical protein